MKTAIAIIGVLVPTFLWAQDYRQIGDWHVASNMDPFTDARVVHILLGNDIEVVPRVHAVAISCNVETKGLWVRVLHSQMTGEDRQNALLIRFGSGPPRTLRGYMSSDNGYTDFTITPNELLDLEHDPTRLAVRFTELGDGNTYQAVWSNLEGTQQALSTLDACRLKAP